jgi:hypothetical protein
VKPIFSPDLDSEARTLHRNRDQGYEFRNRPLDRSQESSVASPSNQLFLRNRSAARPLDESLIEIAALLDLTGDAVKDHLARGRARLLEINAQARPLPDAGPSAVPDPVKARNLIDGFRRLIQERKTTSLDAWISEETSGSVASFAMGTAQDHAAVRAALTERWSNGQTEGRNFRTWRMATTRRVAE